MFRRFLLSALLLVVAGCTRPDSALVITKLAKSKSQATHSGWTIAFERFPDIWSADGQGQSLRRIVKNGTKPTWTPEGKYLTFYRDPGIWICDPDGSRERLLVKQPDYRRESYPGDEVWWSFDSTDGRLMISRPVQEQTGPSTCTIGHEIVRFDPKTQTLWPVHRFQVGQGVFPMSSHSSPTWSPDGNYLALARNGDVWIASKTNEYEPTADNGFLGLTRPWSELQRIDAPAYLSESDEHNSSSTAVDMLAWSPDGLHLAYCSHRIGGSGWSEIGVLDLTFSPQGPTYLPENPVSRKTVVTGSDFPLGVSFSPDGRLTFAAQENNVWCLWTFDLVTKETNKLIQDGMAPSGRAMGHIKPNTKT